MSKVLEKLRKRKSAKDLLSKVVFGLCTNSVNFIMVFVRLEVIT